MNNTNNKVPTTQPADNNELVNAETTDLSTLANLVNKNIDISNYVADNTIDNMRSFLLIYTRNQLSRVIKLTDALNKAEDKLIASIDTVKPQNVRTIINIVNTIQYSLNNSIDLIKQITSDENYLQIIVNNTKLISANISQNIHQDTISKIHDKDSRERVRNAIDDILYQLDKLDSNTDNISSDSNITTIDAEVSKPND